MINYIFLEISMILMFAYLIYKLRHGFHMLQLESYRNERYSTWMSKNKKELIKTRELLLIIPLAIMMFNISIGLIIQVVVTLLLYLSRDIYKEKKPLVVTARIKRLYASTSIIYIIFMIIANLVLGLAYNIFIITIIYAIIDISIVLSMYLVKFLNNTTIPIEKIISNKFYKMANNKISQMTGLKVIGITGSYGKTSTKYALATILRQKYNVLMTPENYNTLSGVERTINENLKPTDEVFVCEMGAKNIGDIKEICDLVHPQYGVLTAIGPQHLETFKTIENVRKTKMELIDALPENGVGFINYEDENVRKTKVDKNNIKFGLKDNLDVYAYNIKISEYGSNFDVHTKNGEIKDIRTKLLGVHNITDIIGAISVATEMGLTNDQIKMGVRYLKPVPHRLELKKNPNGLTIIDDAYNSNISGATVAFETLKMFKDKKRILVTPGMVDFGAESEKYNKEFGKRAANCADYVILVGEKQAKPIKEGLIEENYNANNIYVAKNLEDAIKEWNKFSAKDSVILLENDLPDNYL